MPIFNGNVSVYQAPKSLKIIVKQDDDGEWSNDNAPELLVKMKALAKKLETTVNMFVVDGGTVPTLMVKIRNGKAGEPYMALMPAGEKRSSGYTKLA